MGRFPGTCFLPESCPDAWLLTAVIPTCRNRPSFSTPPTADESIPGSRRHPVRSAAYMQDYGSASVLSSSCGLSARSLAAGLFLFSAYSVCLKAELQIIFFTFSLLFPKVCLPGRGLLHRAWGCAEPSDAGKEFMQAVRAPAQAPVSGRRVQSEDYRSLLRSSTVHLFPEFLRPPLQEMLESMSCAGLVMTPVRDEQDEYLLAARTMLPLPEQDRRHQLEALCHVLEHSRTFDKVRLQACRRVFETCDETVVCTQHLNFVLDAYRAATGSADTEDEGMQAC